MRRHAEASRPTNLEDATMSSISTISSEPLAQPVKASPQAAATRTARLLHGPILRTLLGLAGPNVVVNLILIAVTASVDAHFVGRLGVSALAGVSLVFPLLMLMQQMANGSMGGAIASAIARAMGSGREQDAAALAWHALVIAAAMAMLFSTVLLAGGPAIYALMSSDASIRDAAVEYSNVIFVGALAYWTLSALTSVIRGTGQAMVLAVVYIAAEVLHILLVPLLVFGIGPIPAFGIKGAAMATVASFAASSIVLAWYIAGGRTAVAVSQWRGRFERRLFVEILRVGLPMSAQPFLNNLTLAMLTAFAGALGTTALAGFGAAIRLEYLLYPLSFGLGAGLLAMVGINIGAGHFTRAARITWIAAAIAVCVTGAIGAFGVIWPEAWIAIFNADPTVHAMGASYLMVAGFAYPFLGLGMTMNFAFQAAGRPLWPLLGITGRLLTVVIGGWLSTINSLAGLGFVTAAAMVIFGGSLATAFRAGAWRR
jgi:putative MATE family efflux protein